MTERTYTADEVDAMIARALAREREKPQSIEHCLWARNGHTPCPHVQPAQQAAEPTAFKKGWKLVNEAWLTEVVRLFGAMRSNLHWPDLDAHLKEVEEQGRAMLNAAPTPQGE